MKSLDSLAVSDTRYNSWMHFPEYHLNIYLRLTKRYLNGAMHNTIDLASIVIDEDHRSKNHFSRFLSEVEKIAEKTGRVVYVESLLNKRLKQYLLNNGYTECYIDVNSVFKII